MRVLSHDDVSNDRGYRALQASLRNIEAWARVWFQLSPAKSAVLRILHGERHVVMSTASSVAAFPSWFMSETWAILHLMMSGLGTCA